jgi:hypothetical protein
MGQDDADKMLATYNSESELRVGTSQFTNLSGSKLSGLKSQ